MEKKARSEIEIIQWQPDLVALWATLYKPGVSADAVARVGGQFAKWRAPSDRDPDSCGPCGGSQRIGEVPQERR
jgi:hypothetical protein